MLRQLLSELYRFDGKLASELQENSFSALLGMIVIVLGLSATVITPILPLFVLGGIAFFLPFGRRAAMKFLVIGALSIALGALATVDLPLSQMATVILEGPLSATTYLKMLELYGLFGIAAIGILSLFFLRTECDSGGRTWD